jgi:hypothetical protein
MTKILKLTVRGGACALLSMVALLATAIGNTFAHSPRPGILDTDEAAALYGSGCAADEKSGTFCTSSNKDYCTPNPNGGVGTQCTKNNECAKVSQTWCQRLDVEVSSSYLCDTDTDEDESCSTSCSGNCYRYMYGPFDPQTNNCIAGCSRSSNCGYPICTVTTTSNTP